MSHNAKDIPPGKRAAFQVLAGGSAGFLEVCIMQPLDVVKTRMQIQTRPVIAAGAATASATAATAEVSYSACNFNWHRDQLLAAFKRAELRGRERERE